MYMECIRKLLRNVLLKVYDIHKKRINAVSTDTYSHGGRQYASCVPCPIMRIDGGEQIRHHCFY